MDKEIYRTYIESFSDDMRDYINGTKGNEFNKYHDWMTLLEILEQFRCDMLALVDDAKVEQGELK